MLCLKIQRPHNKAYLISMLNKKAFLILLIIRPNHIYKFDFQFDKLWFDFYQKHLDERYLLASPYLFVIILSPLIEWLNWILEYLYHIKNLLHITHNQFQYIIIHFVHSLESMLTISAFKNTCTNDKCKCHSVALMGKCIIEKYVPHYVCLKQSW